MVVRDFILILMISIFLISSVSAFSWVATDDFIKDSTTSDYGKYQIYEKDFYLFKGDLKLEVELNSNTEKCGDGDLCISVFKTLLLKDGTLFDKFNIYNKDNMQPDRMRWIRYEYYGNVIDYNLECKESEIYKDQKNSTTYLDKTCYQVESGSHEDWISYSEGQILPASEKPYIWRAIGDKAPHKNIEWTFTKDDIETTRWSTWGNISTGSQSEVVLISPANNSIQYGSIIQLIGTGNITTSAYLTNVSQYSNKSGSWSLDNTTNITTSNILADATLKSYYKFDEPSGTTLFDNKSVIDATNTNAVVNQSGKINKSYFFNGAASPRVVLNSEAYYQGTSGVTTFSWWFKTNDTDGTSFMKDNSYVDGAANGYACTHEAGGILRCWTFNANVIDQIVAGGNLSDSQWHFAVFTFGSSGRYLYVDGTLRNSSASTAQSGFGGSRTALGFGAIYRRTAGAYQTFFDGYLDEIGIWNRTLSVSEVASLYNGGLGSRGFSNFYNASFNNVLGIGSYKWNLKFCASDGTCGFATSNYTFSEPFVEISRSLNSSTLETSHETYSINISNSNVLTSVKMIYNATEYEMVNSNNVWSYSMDVPSSFVGNNTIQFKITYNGVDYYTSTSTQEVKPIIFTLCNATYATPFLNLSFKDESTLNYINSSIGASSWTYYLGTGTQTKSYLYLNTGNQSSYTFCATPNITMYVNPVVQYNLGTNYPQRIWQPLTQSYSNSTTNQILYSLSSTNGIYVTFQTRNEVLQAMQDVTVYVNRSFSGVPTQIGIGTTGADGGVTFFLNPDFLHDVLFVKSGVSDYLWSNYPTQSLYAITLGTIGTGVQTNLLDGITTNVNPVGGFLYTGTTYTFNYTINSLNSNLEEYGFSIIANGTNLDTETGSNPSGGTLSTNINTGNYSKIYMNYYYKINGSYSNNTYYWITQSTVGTDASIYTGLQRVLAYMNLGIYGIDDFGRAIVSILVLVITAGVLVYRYGWQNENVVLGVVFGLVWFFEIGVKIIPPINLNGVNSTYPLCTIFTGVILLVSVIKEELR